MPPKKTSTKANVKQENEVVLHKRLYRSQTDKILGGVAGGLGHYFDIDSTVFRLLFVLLAVFGGSGFLIYIILWLIIPDEASQQPTNEATVKHNAEEIKEKAESFAHDIRTSNRSDSRYIWGVLLIVLGILFIIDNFVVLDFLRFDKLWPLLLVALGLAILTKNKH